MKLLLLLGLGFILAKDKDGGGSTPGDGDNSIDPDTGKPKSDEQRDKDSTYGGKNAQEDFAGVLEDGDNESRDGRSEMQRQLDEMWEQQEQSQESDSTTQANPDIDPNYPLNSPHGISWSDLLHVCNGDPNKPDKPGGHLFGTGTPGKTEFPEGWEMDDIGPALSSVASNPNRAWMTSSGNYFAEGVHNGVTIIAVVRPDGSIEAGWPVSGPGVETNPG